MGNLADIPNIDTSFEMLGLVEFASRMSVCPNTIRNWILNGKLTEGVHYLHVGNVYRFPWSTEFVEKLMRSLAPESAPHRPRMQSRRGNRGRLHYRP